MARSNVQVKAGNELTPRAPRSLFLLITAMVVWVFSTLPVPYLLYLYILQHPSGPLPVLGDVRGFYAYPHGTEQILIPYYERLAFGTMFLGVAGPFAIWQLPRRFLVKKLPSVILGLLAGLALAEMLVRVSAPAASYAVMSPSYVVFSTTLAAGIAAYLRTRAVAVYKRDFLFEAVIAWFVISHLFASLMALFHWDPGIGWTRLQFLYALPALAAGIVSGALLWDRRAKTAKGNVTWAVAIGFIIGKILVTMIILFVVTVMRSLAIFVLGFEYLAGDLFLGQPLIWGIIMGLRRWQYLKQERAPGDVIDDRSGGLLSVT